MTANNTGFLPNINKQQSVQTAILGISASNIKEGLSVKTSHKWKQKLILIRFKMKIIMEFKLWMEIQQIKFKDLTFLLELN